MGGSEDEWIDGEQMLNNLTHVVISVHGIRLHNQLYVNYL